GEDTENSLGEKTTDDGVEITSPTVSRRSRRLARKRIPEPHPLPAEEERIVALPGGGRLRIVTRPLGSIGSPLPAPENKRQDLRARMNERVNKIRAQVFPPDEPTLALIEILNYQDPRNPDLRRQFRRR